MLEMKIKIEADAAVLKAIDKLTTALEKSAVNISVQDSDPPGWPVWTLYSRSISLLRNTRHSF